MCGSERENESDNPSWARGKKLQSIRRVVARHSLLSSKCFEHFSSEHISCVSCCHPKATEDPALPFICQRRRRGRRRRSFFMYWFTGEEKAAPANNQLSLVALHSGQRWNYHISTKPWDRSDRSCHLSLTWPLTHQPNVPQNICPINLFAENMVSFAYVA